MMKLVETLWSRPMLCSTMSVSPLWPQTSHCQLPLPSARAITPSLSCGALLLMTVMVAFASALRPSRWT